MKYSFLNEFDQETNNAKYELPGVSLKFGHSLISLFLNFYSSQRNELGLKRNIKPLPLNHVSWKEPDRLVGLVEYVEYWDDQ